MGGVKNTPMRDFHTEMGAKMVPVSGWNMPLAFPEGSAGENRHTRSGCSIFDDTPAGKFQISGEKAAQQLDALLFYPVADMEVGECRFNLLLNEDGGVAESLRLCRMREQDFFLIGNAANVLKTEAVFQAKQIPFRNLTEDLSKIDIQGPETLAVLEESGVNLSELPSPDHVAVVEIDGLRAIAMHTSFTGEEGFELMMTADCADQIWDLFLDSEEIEPAGLAARDSLRIEMGVPVYNAELRNEWSPFDSGLEAALSGSRDFTGKDALLKRPRLRRFAGVILEGKHAPRAGAEIRNADGKVIGMVSSGAFSPALNCSVALCSLAYDCSAEEGSAVQVSMPNGTAAGKIAPVPFIR